MGCKYGPAGSTLIQDRVASFGACRAVVFGNYGEASRDVHTLIHVAAQRLATKHWRLLGAGSQGEVHGFYVAQLRRRMGVTAVREFARHRRRRAAYVGVPRRGRRADDAAGGDARAPARAAGGHHWNVSREVVPWLNLHWILERLPLEMFCSERRSLNITPGCSVPPSSHLLLPRIFTEGLSLQSHDLARLRSDTSHWPTCNVGRRGGRGVVVAREFVGSPV